MMLRLAAVSSLVLALFACGGTGGSGGTGGLAADCRFAGASCSACIAASCAAETSACYGAGWVPADLCSGTASAMCTQATSAQDGLDKQTAYGTCVVANCTSDCE